MDDFYDLSANILSPINFPSDESSDSESALQCLNSAEICFVFTPANLVLFKSDQYAPTRSKNLGISAMRRRWRL